MPSSASVASGEGELVLVARDGARLDVTINRPEKRNALSRPALALLKEAFAAHAGNERIKVAVLSGAGEKSFAAGGDLIELSSIRTVAAAEQMSRETRSVLDVIRHFPVPVIAALNGDALGGGAELAVACDFRVAAPHARIGFVQGKLAITTAWGGGIDLGALVGPGKALSLLARADLLDAADARALGLIDDVASSDTSLATAIDHFITPFLAQPRQVLAAFKALAVAHRCGASRRELEDIETKGFAEAWVHEDHWAAAHKILSRSAQ